MTAMPSHPTMTLERLAPDGVWTQLAAPLGPATIAWRQDGKTIARDGRYLARFVAYIEATTVFERLDAIVPGEWESALELLPSLPTTDDDANQGVCSFKCTLTILGVSREDVGTGKDYKQASTDAFKRAAVRFGIARELYAYEQNWVQMDGDGKFARPVEDPGVAYARRYGGTKANGAGPVQQLPHAPQVQHARPVGTMSPTLPDGPPDTLRTTAELPCPKCGGRTWDNRLTKRNPKAPDFKCRDRACDGVIWPGDEPAFPASARANNLPTTLPPTDAALQPAHGDVPPDDLYDREIPF